MHLQVNNSCSNLISFQLRGIYAEVNEEIINFECEKCSYKCATEKQLTEHISNMHSKQTGFKCTNCDFTSNNELEYYAHQLAKHAANTMKCLLCSFETQNKENLEAHIKTNSGKQKFSIHI